MKKVFLFILSLLCAFSLQAENIETDVTAQFPLDWQGWTGATGYVGWAAPQVTTNDGRQTAACEQYNEATIAQTGVVFSRMLSGLANGQYTIELYGAAAFTPGRSCSSTLEEGDETAVYLYAETPAGTVKQFIPAHVADNFNSSGISTATLEGVQVTDGTITIGMYKEQGLTNWHVVQIKGVTAVVDKDELIAARFKALEDALAAGEAIKSNVPAESDAIATYDAAVADVKAANENRTLEYDVAAAVAVVNAAAKELSKAQTADGSDLSAFIVNAEINGETGWTIERPLGGNGPLLNDASFEYWAGNASSRADASFDYYQVITGLPNGLYTVSAEMFNSLNGEGGEYTIFAPTSGVYAAAGETEVNKLVDVDGTELITYTTDQILVEDGTLRIGVKNFSTPMAARWFVADNFKLTLVKALNAEGLAYQHALAAIENGAIYRIKTDVEGQTYYVAPDGTLTASSGDAGGFEFEMVPGEFMEYGFKMKNGAARFSNAPLSNNQAVLNPAQLSVTTGNDRNTWEAQVFFLQDGKYAIRTTNVAYGETGWADAGRVFWTVNEGPVAQYSYTANYIWDLECVCTAEDYAARKAAAEVISTWVPTIQAAKGLVQDASKYISNAKDPAEGSYEALLDGDYSSFFHSTWHTSNDPQADHYLQAELPDAAQAFYFYFKKRSQNNNNRPTTIVVSGSNDGENFTEITTINQNLPTDAGVIDYLSDKITGNEAYKYIRLTVPTTNNGAKTGDHVFFTFSELYLLPSIDVTDEALALVKANTPTYLLDPAKVKEIDDALKAVMNTVNVTYALYDADGTEPIQEKVIVQEGGSDVKVPAEFTNIQFYDYAIEGTIGNEDCTVKVTRSFKEGVVKSLDELSNDKAYTIRCDRGALLTKDGFLASTAHSTLNDAEPANFAVINFEDHYYIYSVDDKKFVTNNGQLADVPTNGEADAICMTPKSVPYFMFYFQMNESTQYGLNTNGNDPYGYVINNWMTADPGNQYYMIAAADFDPSEALAALNPQTGIEIADIATLKTFTPEEETADVILKLTDAKVTFVTSQEQTDYDEDWNEITVTVDRVVIEDASGATMLEGTGLGASVQAGDILNGELALTVSVLDYSAYGMGIIRETAPNDYTAASIAALEKTAGTAEPTVINDETLEAWAADPDWRYVRFENVPIKVVAGNYGDELQLDLSDYTGEPIGILDSYGVLTEAPADGTIVNFTGFFTNYLGSMPIMIPTEIQEIIKGDVNNDQEVDVADHAQIRDHILAAGDYIASYDINEDQNVDVSDLTGLVNIILYGNWQGETGGAGVRALESTASILSLNRVSEGRYALSLNTSAAFNGLQMDLNVPAGMTLVAAESDGAHSVMTSQLANGMTRVLVYATDNAAFAADQVLYLRVNGQGTLTADNIVFADMNANAVKMTLGEADGINGIGIGENSKIYDLGGRQTDNLRRGINLVRKADGSTTKVLK